MKERQELESELGQLFDASAEVVEGADLTRLRARAAEVPERAPRTPRWLPRWVWAPALGGLCAGAGALAAALFGDAGPLAPANEDPPVIVSASAAAPPSASAATSIEDEIDVEPSEDEDSLTFDLSADVPDAELDAWLAALEGS